MDFMYISRILVWLVRIFVIFIECVHGLTNVGLLSSSKLPVQTAAASPTSSSSSSTKSGPIELDESLLQKPNSDILVTMTDTHDSFLDGFLASDSSTPKSEKNTVVAYTLHGRTQKSQAPVLSVLKTFSVNSVSYWITNQIFIKDATPTIIQGISGLPGVKSIIENFKLPLPPVFNVTVGKPPEGPEWNIKRIGAHKIWNDTTGEGIIVGGIDTGVRVTHTALKKNYIGKIGWHDPFLATSEPEDTHGHGTHTMATAVGQGGIGVAPGAKWMACRGCFLENCMQHALIACGQYLLCPGGDAKNKKCGAAPHVINNSWGGPGGPTWFEPIIKAWRAADIIPVFAIGNSGPKCETLGSPGESESVLAVGSTNKKDTLSKFSSRGPKVDGEESGGGPLGLLGSLGSFKKLKRKIVSNVTKPDFCAPGQEINSAHMVTDNAYRVLSGTSMASPAVTGAVALLLAVNPNLTYDELKDLFTSTAVQTLEPIKDGKTCGPVPENRFPNHMFGYGRINVYEAYHKMIILGKRRRRINKTKT